VTTTILGLAHELPPPRGVGRFRRPIVAKPTGVSSLASGVAVKALERAGLGAEDVELIIFATMTPDFTFPGAACFFQRQVGFATIGAMDLRAQCAGFLVGLMTADAFLASGKYSRVLLATAEVHSSGLDFSAPGLPIAELYGDGAAVTILGSGRGPRVAAVCSGADGRHFDRFWIEYPSSRQHPLRVTPEDLRAGKHYPRIDFEAVAGFARERLPEVVRRVVGDAGTALEKVDCFIFSHVLPGVAEEAAAALGIAAARLRVAGAEHGHLTAASLPVALSEAVQAGALAAGSRVCLATCGAGYTWGAAVLEM
jgi:3-oxoacyl-[acyl-carrier-protein] synthase-3